MRQHTDEELKVMSLKEAKNNICNDVYEGSRIIESLEMKGKISGNGHHIRQKIAAYAEKIMEERWIK